MWSSAVFDPAFPGRSMMLSGSPVPAPPWSTNAHNGWKPYPRERRPGVLLLAVRSDQGGVDIDDQRLAGIDAVVGGVWSGRGPDPCPGACPGPVDRRQDLVHVRGQTGDRARQGRVRGDRTEDRRLGAHDREV